MNKDSLREEIEAAEAAYLAAKTKVDAEHVSAPPQTPRRRMSGVHWVGLLVLAGAIWLGATGGSEADRARASAKAQELDALARCQRAVAQSTGTSAGDVPFARPRSVAGGFQVLFPAPYQARCEVRDGRIAELVVAGRTVR